MSDLEEMGLILQPHTSAGRIPSDAGYRLYVDRMMEEKDQEVTEMKELMVQRQDRMELLLKQVVRILAANTNYATMITGPRLHRTKLKFIQLSIVDEHQILAVIVTEANVVKNKIIRHGPRTGPGDRPEAECPAEHQPERADHRTDQSGDDLRN